MRITLFLFFLAPFIAFSQINQTDSNGLRQGFWQKKQPDGKLVYEGNFKDGKPTGEWKRYHPGGQIKAIINYRNDSDTADVQIFDEWRKKIAEGSFLFQKKTGLWTYFSGTRRISDEQMANGLKHGKSRKYYDTGEIWEETDWNDGIQEGNYQVFFKNGEPFFQCKMSNNQRHGLCLTYFQNGSVELEAYYKKGLRHGEWKYYNEDGDFLYSLIYVEGEIQNPNVRDSIENLKIMEFEKNKDKVTDPEKYISDPSEYLMKMKIY
jgi:antitoxin component YwqK of YwqJK toxin-antitoxin module